MQSRSITNSTWRRDPLRLVVGILLSLALLMPSVSAETAAFSSLMRQAESLHDQSDYTRAIAALRKAVSLEPRNFKANYLLGVDLMRTGKPGEAIVHLRTALSSEPASAAAAETLARAATETGDFALASETLNTAVERSNRDVRTLQAMATYSMERFRVLGTRLRQTRLGEGVELRVEAASRPDGPERAKLLEQSAQENPGQRGIWGELGVSQLAIRSRAGVETSLTEARKREPEGAETLQLEALLAAIEGKWADAEMKLEAIGERSQAQLNRSMAGWVPVLQPPAATPGTVLACLREHRIPCVLENQKPAKSVPAASLYAQGRWEQIAALPPSRSWGKPDWLWRGVALAVIGKCGPAIPALERAGDDLYGQFWLEICYGSQGEYAARLIADAGDQVALHELRGDLLLHLNGDAQHAREQYQTALASRPEDPVLLARLAEVLVALHEPEEAAKQAQAALAIDQNQDAALRVLIEIQVAQREYKQAIPLLGRFARLYPGDPWPRVELGRAYAQIDQPDLAIRYLKPALAAGYPDEKGALHALLARMLRRVGLVEEARKVAAEATKLSDAAQGGGDPGAHQ